MSNMMLATVALVLVAVLSLADARRHRQSGRPRQLEGALGSSYSGSMSDSMSSDENGGFGGGDRFPNNGNNRPAFPDYGGEEFDLDTQDFRRQRRPDNRNNGANGWNTERKSRGQQTGHNSNRQSGPNSNFRQTARQANALSSESDSLSNSMSSEENVDNGLRRRAMNGRRSRWN